MQHTRYPPGTVRALLETDLVTPSTRDVLKARLGPAGEADPRFFDVHAFTTLRAVCARLLPQAERAIPVDLAGALDARLAEGKCDGWRYAAMPPDEDAYQAGLRGLDERAQALFGTDFCAITGAQQDDLLGAVQRGDVAGGTWDTLPARRFFEELLAELSECYYSDPLTQEEIGYVGMADAHGWHAIGLNQLDPHEPRADSSPAPVTHSPLPAAAPTRPSPHPLPSHPRRYTPHDVVDAVVIGTGAGGAPLLARLAAAGLRVVALEAGRHWTPAHDFATDERAQANLFWNDERLSAGEHPIAFGNNNSGIGVGGSTLHYTAYVPRPQPDDFRLHTEFGVGHDWPLSYGELESYYDELEQFLGVSGPSQYPWGPPRRSPYPLAALPLNGAAQLMQRGCAALGMRTSPAANAALSAPYFQPGVGWRAACTNRGFCQAGCSTGAKASMDVTFVPLALQAGAELRTECFVTQLETDRTGEVTGVVYQQHGVEQRQRCGAVFLCAGAIETPRLLLLNGLGNSSGQVGRNFMAHMGLQVWGQFADDVRPYKGIPGGLISEETHRPADADFAGGYLVQSIGVMPVTYALQLARGRGLWGAAVRAHMHGYNHTAGINILGDCLPYAHNYLDLSDERDARGLPKPRIQFTLGVNEHRMNAHAEALLREIWTRAGAHDIWAFPRYAHTIGTCRMGTDPAQAVVDPDGRSFDVPNLYIVDNSVFPSALSANPALTIMALALRTADRFLRQTR